MLDNDFELSPTLNPSARDLHSGTLKLSKSRTGLKRTGTIKFQRMSTAAVDKHRQIPDGFMDIAFGEN